MGIEVDIHANRVRTGQMFPNLILQDEQGSQVQIQDYRQRSNLILVFSGEPIGAGFQQLLEGLSRRYPDIRFEKAEALAILDGTHMDLAKLQAGQDYPFPLLLDPGGEAHREAGAVGAGGQPVFTVLVLDRYCEIYALFRMDGSTERPSAQALIEWLEYIELQCDE